MFVNFSRPLFDLEHVFFVHTSGRLVRLFGDSKRENRRHQILRRKRAARLKPTAAGAVTSSESTKFFFGTCCFSIGVGSERCFEQCGACIQLEGGLFGVVPGWLAGSGLVCTLCILLYVFFTRAVGNAPSPPIGLPFERFFRGLSVARIPHRGNRSPKSVFCRFCFPTRRGIRKALGEGLLQICMSEAVFSPRLGENCCACADMFMMGFM